MKFRIAASGENEYGKWKRFEAVMTNADLLRAKTDEELAEFLVFVAQGCDWMYPGCPASKMCGVSGGTNSCDDAWREWLNQEADK